MCTLCTLQTHNKTRFKKTTTHAVSWSKSNWAWDLLLWLYLIICRCDALSFQSIHSSLYLCVFISLVFDSHVTSTCPCAYVCACVYAVRASNALALCINAAPSNHLFFCVHACSNWARKSVNLYFLFESYHFRCAQKLQAMQNVYFFLLLHVAPYAIMWKFFLFFWSAIAYR